MAGVQRFGITWEEIEIEVSFELNWLNSDQAHLELRATQPLPVTQTGYRSHFMALQEPWEEGDFRSFVVEWLDEQAKERAWITYVENSRQGELF